MCVTRMCFTCMCVTRMGVTCMCVTRMCVHVCHVHTHTFMHTSERSSQPSYPSPHFHSPHNTLYLYLSISRFVPGAHTHRYTDTQIHRYTVTHTQNVHTHNHTDTHTHTHTHTHTLAQRNGSLALCLSVCLSLSLSLFRCFCLPVFHSLFLIYRAWLRNSFVRTTKAGMSSKTRCHIHSFFCVSVSLSVTIVPSLAVDPKSCLQGAELEFFCADNNWDCFEDEVPH